MTAIWQDHGDKWTLLAPSGFPDEKTLHGLVERAPQILPLSGSPTLAVVGREVGIGGNRADLMAVEQSGRLVIIEIKLAHNAEARRAVIAQILTYAALLRGLEIDELENQVLALHLQQRGHTNLADAVQGVDQVGAFDAENFESGLLASLQDGAFRLVLVLDDAPPELVKLVGYLVAITDKLMIDLITVASYEIAGSSIVVPRRIDPQREPSVSTSRNQRTSQTVSSGTLYPGSAEFLASIDNNPSEQQFVLRKLVEWASQLEQEGLVTLTSYRGKTGRMTLLPRLPGDEAGLVTIWNDSGPSLSLWRSVFERRAPASLARFDEDPELPTVGQGNTSRKITDRLLDELTAAYRETRTGTITVDGQNE